MDGPPGSKRDLTPDPGRPRGKPASVELDAAAELRWARLQSPVNALSVARDAVRALKLPPTPLKPPGATATLRLRTGRTRDLDPDDEPPGYYHWSQDEPPAPRAREETAAKPPRHRPPDQLPIALAERLQDALVRRAANPEKNGLSQEAIAQRCGCKRSRVEKAIKLRAAGWDLLRSHPDFSADHGFVRWPSPAQAARLLASERR